MSQAPSIFDPNFSREFAGRMLGAVNDGMMLVVNILWQALLSFLSQHWLIVTAGLFLLFIILTFKAKLGYWGSLGSFLYNLFFFGTLFIIGLIWGPGVFINDAFNVLKALLIYPICFLLVRLALNGMGVMRHI